MSEWMDEAEWSQRYQMLGVIGRGASATVFRAQRVSDGEEVAIKELDLAWTADADAIAKDTETFASLRCEGVPRVIESVRVRQRGLEVVYLVLEHIEGVTLEREARERRYTTAEVFALLAELLEILARLHAHGIVHRDVKPANVVRRPDGRLALIDLGSAVIARDAPADARFTASGTIGYAPPEQLAGVARPANDVYAAGALAVSLLTREHPAALLDAHLRIDWRARAILPHAQAKLLDALLAPADVRPEDARALAERSRAVAHARPWPRGLRFAGQMAGVSSFVVLAAWATSSFAVARVAEARVAEARPAEASSAPVSPSATVMPPSTWGCDVPGGMRLETLPPGASRCWESDSCRSLAAGFEDLDLTALCSDESDSGQTGPTASVVVSSVRRFSTSIRGEEVDCTRRSEPYRECIVSCTHRVETSASQQELEARFERYLTTMRDTYGAEQSGAVQGMPRYPRRAHRWRAGADTVALELDRSLCCAPSDRGCGITAMRTVYSRMPWSP